MAHTLELMADTTDSTDTTETVTIQPVQTATLRQHGSKRLYQLTVTTAINAAGLADGGSVRFDLDTLDELGLVPAIGSTQESDGRRREAALTRNIITEGQGNVYRITIPHAVLAALGIDLETINWDDPPTFTVYAGDRVLALELPTEQQIMIERRGPHFDRQPRLTDLAAIGDAIAPRLRDAGYETIDDLYEASEADLRAIDGIGPRSARRIIATLYSDDIESESAEHSEGTQNG